MAANDNAFCWHGIATTDADRAATFYPEVLGWSAPLVPMGDEQVRMFGPGDASLAHVEATEPGDRPHWNHYLRVDDVDARTEAAVAAGGTLVVHPTDIAPGRFSVVTSPSGAALYLFREPAETAPAGRITGPGSVHWVELWSSSLDADLSWLETAFGLQAKRMEMPNGPYYVLEHEGTSRGGAMASDEGPAHWLAWVEVEDVDAAVARTASQGGTTLQAPFDVPTVGRMAVVADPTGARFGIIVPANS